MESKSSSYICKMCLYELTNCLNFIERCIKSNNVIRSLETCMNNKNTDNNSRVIYLDFARNQSHKSNSANETSGINLDLSNLTELELPTKVIIEDDIDIKPETKFEVEDAVEPESVSENEVEFEYDFSSEVDLEVQKELESESKTEIIDEIDPDENFQAIVTLEPEAKVKFGAEQEVVKLKQTTRNYSNSKQNKDVKVLQCSECNIIPYHKSRKHICKFVCAKCDNQFGDKEQLQKHVEDNVDEDECKLPCQYCPLLLPTKELAAHEKTHPTYLCTICSKLFLTRGSLTTHFQTHNERIHKCPECELSFKTRSCLRGHIQNKHSNLETSDLADTIPESYSGNVESCKKTDCLTDDIKENEVWKYLCDRCPRRFSNNAKLTIHKKRVHDRIPGGICTKCGKTFTNQRIADEHDRVVHLKQLRYCCEVCGHLFGVKDNMLKHTESCRRRLDQGKQFVGYKNTTRTTNDHQQLTHNHGFLAAHPVECVYCKKVLRTLPNLILHVKSVHLKAPRPFKCEVCHLQFTTKFNVTKHERIHQDPEGKFRCNVCYKKFIDVDELDKHISESHKKTSYECDECGEKFAREYLMDNHKYSVHNSQQTFEANSKEMIETAIKHAQLTGNMKMHYKRGWGGRKATKKSEDKVESKDGDDKNKI